MRKGINGRARMRIRISSIGMSRYLSALFYPLYSRDANPLPLQTRDGSTNLIHNLPAAIDRDMSALDRVAFGHAAQEFAGNFGQQCASNNRVDVSGAALHLFATSRDRGQQGVVVSERC